MLESVGRKSGRLERTSAWNGQETLEETSKNAASQGRSRGRKHGHGRMKEDEGG